jgi:drug/metabolite transporter (DMT)-like permease
MPISALLLAITTICLWGFQAAIVNRLSHLPPLFLIGVSLTLCGLFTIPWIKTWKVPLKTFLIGVGSLFGYHFLLFTSYQYADVVEANIINYLWPLFIVVFSPLYLKNSSLRAYHIVGAVLGMVGVWLIITNGKLVIFGSNYFGYILAFLAALVWSNYSLITKRLPTFADTAVCGFCFFAGLIACAVYSSEANIVRSIINLTIKDWGYLLILAIGPMTIGLFTWSAALKRGDARIIGALSYLTPMLSTLFLVILNKNKLTWISFGAMCLIVLGAIIGSRDLFTRKNSLTVPLKKNA